MEEYDFFGFRCEVDGAAVRRWYGEAEEWGCTCGHCRNFLALARARALPGPILDALDRLGIPPEKATYVCELYPTDGGHCYQFSCRLAGRILGGDGQGPEPWGEALCWHEPYPCGAPGFPEPHFDLQFCVALPWVLDEPDA